MWLSKDCINAALYPPNEAESDNVMTDQLLSPTSSSRKKIQSNDILCVHQALDPTKAQSMKRISQVCLRKQIKMLTILTLYKSQRTYRDIIENTKCQFDPALSPSDVCRACVETIFRGDCIRHWLWWFDLSMLQSVCMRSSIHASFKNSIRFVTLRTTIRATGYQKNGFEVCLIFCIVCPTLTKSTEKTGG